MDTEQMLILPPELLIMQCKFARANDADPLRVLQDETLRLAPLISAMAISKSEVVEALASAARNSGLCSRYRLDEVRHVIAMAANGISSLLPRGTLPFRQSEVLPPLGKGEQHDARQLLPAWLRAAITAEQLEQEIYEPIQFVVPDLIPAEGVTLLCSKPKFGKSWLALDLCIGCTTNRFILGQIKPRQGDVLYLALEDSPRRLQRRMAKLLPTFKGQWPKGLTFATTWRRVNEGGLDDIRAWHKSVEKPTLVVVDVLVKVRPISTGRRSAYELDYEALAGLHNLAIDLGVAVIVVHHTRKMAAEDIMDTVSGSFGLVGAADTIIVIERRGQGAVFDVRGRDVESAELAIQFNKETCRWTLLGFATDVHRSAERARLLAVMAEAKEPLSPKEIMIATGRSDRNAVDQLLFRMVQAGDIAKVARGKYSHPNKIDKKEILDQQQTDIAGENGKLTNLTDLTGAQRR
jgi:AAA domain